MSEKKQKKRFNITLPDGDYQDLQRLAKARGDDTATRAAYFVQRSLEESRERGEIPAISDLPNDEALTLLIGFLNALLDTGSHNGYSLAEISEILGRENDRELIVLVEKIRNGNGDKNRKVTVR